MIDIIRRKTSLVFVAAVLLFANSSFAQQTSFLGQPLPITAPEYTQFLNSVASTDIYGLYNVKMGEESETGALITRSGEPGSYTYSYNPAKASSPITYVSWFSAIRYCNWRSNQCATGPEGSTTTESGSYDLAAFDQGGDSSTIILMPGAKFYLPANYLIDVTTQEVTTQSTNPYFASNLLGFSIATWSDGDSSSNAGNGKNHGASQGGVAGGNANGIASGSASSSSATGSGKGSGNGTTSGKNAAQTSFMGSSAHGMLDSHQINISLVAIDAPNNAADTNNAGTNPVAYGAVLMPYQIGTYDVTAEQYCAFLNAVAAKSDLHQLYNTNMSSDPDVACITRSGDDSSGYTYVPMSGREKFPVTYVSWYSALRFCNWLENNQPMGDQAASSTENGAYNIASGAAAVAGAAWALPSEDQWYKAAYYQAPTKGATNGTYYSFGMGSMNIPGNQLGKVAVANEANYALNGTFTTSSDPHLTPVGSFSKSASPWGAYDMAGEVGQWLYAFDASGNNVITRGGSWQSQSSDDLKSTARLASTGMGSATVGFRVVFNIPPTPKITRLDMTKDLVVVGDPNNKADLQDGLRKNAQFGQVNTTFQIGKYDVTAEQYCMFLNAVASHADPHNLYNEKMGSDSNVAALMRYGNSNQGYSYFTIPGREKFPITYVSWYSALRFCNWLENNQPVGDEAEGTTESGSFNNGDNGFSIATGNPKWLLPTESQWYKAAYYSSAQGGYYFAFGTGGNDIPVNNSLTASNAANYCVNGIFTQPAAPYLMPVGSFPNTKSFYGAYDMTGEVNQWTLSPYDSTNIVVRGGSWASTNYSSLRFSQSYSVDPTSTMDVVGFRVVYNVSPPPPSMFSNMYNGTAVAFKAVKDDVTGLLTGQIFKDPGTYFFNVMYYSVGAGLSEIAANAVNLLIRGCNFLFTQIATWVRQFLGEDAIAFINQWLKPIYDFIFSAIKSGKLNQLRSETLRAEMNKTFVQARTYVAQQAANGEAAANGFADNLIANGAMDPLMNGAGLAPESIEALEAANLALSTAVAEEAAYAGVVGFFASPAAAVVIPALLIFGSYEAFVATTSSSASQSNDPRIAIGLVADTAIRYIWPALRLLMP